MSAGPRKDVQTSARVRTRGTVVGKQASLSKRALVATAKAFFSVEISLSIRFFFVFRILASIS